jgi:hypothetical protein
VLGTFTVTEMLDGYTTAGAQRRRDHECHRRQACILMEKQPALDRLIDPAHYRKSSDPSTGFDPFGDYSGQTYLAVAKATGVPALREHPVWRYFELAVGYGTRGYHVGPEFPGDRSRNIYYGISLNLSELLSRTAFRSSERKNTTQRFVDLALGSPDTGHGLPRATGCDGLRADESRRALRQTDHSLMPISRMSFAQRGSSRRMRSAKASGLLAISSMPRPNFPLCRTAARCALRWPACR